ncbi:hypothetical protein MM239_12250 [Belliella sp. DSM 111904]|uniref:Uncharacterized protein n=1 Tax=Belliella filtrata TaxID=2923435 RepID=A0ABS9V2F1_9BACT|nr:hypothetical protein [Belliella filtrata]MCH7410170.1 hypothetical protein [Belliella filtrata]
MKSYINNVDILNKEDNLRYLKEQICPITNVKIKQSPYLAKVFQSDEKTLWIANLITHYRHNIYANWYVSCICRRDWTEDFYEEKDKVNEIAMKQIIKKAHKILIDCGITPEVFGNLEGTTEETMKVAKKFLTPKSQK